jgi:uncharacterized membrane protein
MAQKSRLIQRVSSHLIKEAFTMKKVGTICLVIGMVGFLAYTFKMSVIGYFESETEILNVLGVVLVIFIIVSFVLRWLGSRQENEQEKAKAEKALQEKYQKKS